MCDDDSTIVAVVILCCYCFCVWRCSCSNQIKNKIKYISQCVCVSMPFSSSKWQWWWWRWRFFFFQFWAYLIFRSHSKHYLWEPFGFIYLINKIKKSYRAYTLSHTHTRAHIHARTTLLRNDLKRTEISNETKPPLLFQLIK